MVAEGKEITATCTAHGERGSIFFYFYENATEIEERQVNSNQIEVKLRLSSVGTHRIHCAYAVFVRPDSFKSEESNAVSVTVEGEGAFENACLIFRSIPSHRWAVPSLSLSPQSSTSHPFWRSSPIPRSTRETSSSSRAA